MNIKTFELAGAALDWAVAKAVCGGGPLRIFENDHRVGFLVTDAGNLKRGGFDGRVRAYTIFNSGEGDWRPSTDWAQGGPLIAQFDIGLLPPCVSPCYDTDGAGRFTPWAASFSTDPDLGDGYGRTPLVAACRAIVRRRLGETVNIPDELCAVVAQAAPNVGPGD